MNMRLREKKSGNLDCNLVANILCAMFIFAQSQCNLLMQRIYRIIHLWTQVDLAIALLRGRPIN